VSVAASDAGLPRTRSLLSGRQGRIGSARPARQRFQSISLEFVGPIDPEPLAQALLDPALHLFRAKALAQDSQGRGVLIQIVGTRSEVVPSNHRNPERGRLICIGARGELDQSAVEAVLQTALQYAESKDATPVDATPVDATSIDATSVDTTPKDATPKVSRVD
jgi:Cobalamin synthesis protein cobW C-terminal domain